MSTPTVLSIDHGTVRNNMVFYVRLDEETNDFAHLIGREVEINGLRWKCIGVERYMHSAPWHKGEVIGLMVEPL